VREWTTLLKTTLLKTTLLKTTLLKITLFRMALPRTKVTWMKVTRVTLPSMGLFSIRFHAHVERHVNLLLAKKNFANKLTVTLNG
jgi:hypothetical protein